MKEPHNIVKTEQTFDKTINLKKLIGKKVLSKGGKITGRVVELRLNPKNLQLEGILIKRGIAKKSIYIDRSYFSYVSQNSVILKIELSILIKNKKVINSKGKIIGKVKEVVRKGNKNDLEGVYVRSMFSKKFFISESEIEYVNQSIMLKAKYNATKNYFWQKTK